MLMCFGMRTRSEGMSDGVDLVAEAGVFVVNEATVGECRRVNSSLYQVSCVGRM